MSKSFDDAFAALIGNEGGYKKEKEDHMDWDSGVIGKGELRGTKYGITAGAYPLVDIENLTLEGAKAIYHRDYWSHFNGDALDASVAFQLFDAYVNHGPGQGSRLTQKALGVTDDGIVGPQTLMALAAIEPKKFIMRLTAERLLFFSKLKTWNVYGAGWANRMAANLKRGAQ